MIWLSGWHSGYETDHHHYHPAVQHRSEHIRHSSEFSLDKHSMDNNLNDENEYFDDYPDDYPNNYLARHI